MADTVRQHTLREPKSTDPFLDFGTYHTLVMAVAQHLGIDVAKKESAPVLRLIELDENLPAYDEGADKVDGKMPYVDKKGTVLYYDPGTQTWKRDETQQKEVVCNPYKDKSYTEGDRIVALYLQQAGKFVPLPYPGMAFHPREIMGGYLAGSWEEMGTGTDALSCPPEDYTSDKLVLYSAMFGQQGGEIALWDGSAWMIREFIGPFEGTHNKRYLPHVYASELPDGARVNIFAKWNADTARVELTAADAWNDQLSTVGLSDLDGAVGVPVRYREPKERFIGTAVIKGRKFVSQPGERLVLNQYNQKPLQLSGPSEISIAMPSFPTGIFSGGFFLSGKPPFAVHLNYCLVWQDRGPVDENKTWRFSLGIFRHEVGALDVHVEYGSSQPYRIHSIHLAASTTLTRIASPNVLGWTTTIYAACNGNSGDLVLPDNAYVQFRQLIGYVMG